MKTDLYRCDKDGEELIGSYEAAEELLAAIDRDTEALIASGKLKLKSDELGRPLPSEIWHRVEF